MPTGLPFSSRNPRSGRRSVCNGLNRNLGAAVEVAFGGLLHVSDARLAVELEGVLPGTVQPLGEHPVVPQGPRDDQLVVGAAPLLGGADVPAPPDRIVRVFHGPGVTVAWFSANGFSCRDKDWMIARLYGTGEVEPPARAM